MPGHAKSSSKGSNTGSTTASSSTPSSPSSNRLTGLADYHMHTPLCNHAVGDPREYVLQAIKLGLQEIGFSEHSPLPPGYDTLRLRYEQVDDYVSMIREVQREFHHFKILLGLECDYVPGVVEYLRDILRQHDFDYVLGSVHYIDKWGFDNPDHLADWKHKDIDLVWKRYFELWREACASGLFDIMAHPDLVKKFGHLPKQNCEQLFRAALEAAAKAKVAVEINTAGLRKPVKEIYPSLRFLEIAREMKIPISIGSDAHAPGEVGMNFSEAIGLAKKAGYKESVRFEGGKRMLRAF
ncbi:MAG: histidinol-phosphatase HisJ family protein [Verrucomicrobiae bacterium]|nr:histidinol-phosphatase HisJ family protein [Verrucomicrobiae bacterium]